MPEMQQRASPISSSTAAANPPPTRTDADAAQTDEGDPHMTASLPPWVHINDDARLLQAPPSARPNTRHYRPPPTHYKPGRKWDHLRSPSPPLLSSPIADSQTRWRPFMYSGPDPQEQQDGARIVSAAWMEEHMPAVGQGWREEDEMRADGEVQEWLSGKGLAYRGRWLISPERQERTVRLFWRLLLKNPFVPLFLRLTVLVFAAVALGMAARIFVHVAAVNADPDPINQCSTRASTYMAVCVGSIAIPYLGYVTWDEYMSKPLGLRSASTKTMLLLCDLFFVIFASSNLSLAFDALYDHRWACFDEQYAIISGSGSSSSTVYNVPATCPNNPSICNRQKALTGMLFISLIAWLTTFSLSVMRVVEKLRPD
ncbi:hypothetical protein LTR36_007348 [Oleoguttula mirabilis]|uniref:Uncharacterized protein n=1 Tax=Oleoguttula mirabilis TaxID=1507867 RepID=A0AAV9JAK6_9PEZI|nr:hypothetical protein LTR36_007348 [Oleoguttula mirabilis]